MALKDLKGYTLHVKFDDLAFTKILYLDNISGPTLEVGQYEFTDLETGILQKRPTVKNYGQITATIGYDYAAASHAALFTMYGANAIHALKYESNSKSYTFSESYIQSINFVGGTAEEQAKIEVVFELSGELTVE
jgi:hypothetical protein